MEKLGCAAIGECRPSRIVMRPFMPGKGVTLARIAVDYRVWFVVKSRLGLDLRRLGYELVLFSPMHQKGRMKIVDLAHAGATTIRLIQAKAMLPVRLGSNAKVNARLLPPE